MIIFYHCWTKASFNFLSETEIFPSSVLKDPSKCWELCSTKGILTNLSHHFRSYVCLKWWDNFVVKISNVQFKQLSQQLLRFSENLVKDSVVLLPDSLQAKQGKIQCYREELLKKIYQLISKIPLFNIGRILAMI